VKGAVDKGLVDEQRYNSYVILRSELKG